MFMCVFYIDLFIKIAASLNHGLNLLAEPPAGLGEGVPGEVGHDLRDLGHQGCSSVVGNFVDVPLTDAPHVVVQGIAVWTTGWPDLL